MSRAPEPQIDAAIPHADTSRSSIGTIIVLCFGGLVAALMQTLIIPIQPELHELLGTTRSNASWVITATLLAAAVAMPVAGRLGDMFGKQRIMAISAVLLTVGSLICALSDTVGTADRRPCRSRSGHGLYPGRYQPDA